MNYVWDLVIEAEKQGITLDQLRFHQELPISPYKELGFENINEQQISREPIPVNGLYRYAPIFEALLEMQDFPELRNALFDILLHRLTELDLREGMTRQEYRQLILRDDIMSEKFGTHIQKAFVTFTKAQQRDILVYLLKLYRLGASHLLLRRIFRALFPHSILYFRTEEQRQELLLYIGEKQTDQLMLQIDFLCHTFVPFDCHVELFWELHFGVVGIDETMMPDEIMLF